MYNRTKPPRTKLYTLITNLDSGTFIKFKSARETLIFLTSNLHDLQSTLSKYLSLYGFVFFFTVYSNQLLPMIRMAFIFFSLVLNLQNR